MISDLVSVVGGTKLIAFFGGTAFRMLWGEVSAWLTKRQDHKHEVERMRLQDELDAKQHSRNMDSIRIQAQLGVQTIRVQGEADVSRAEAEGWRAAVEDLGRPSGIGLVDVWKGIIQPLLATICIVLVVLHFKTNGWVLDERGWELVGAVLGLFVADRLLFKRGK